jgi:putative peptide maturation dehydrogenase
VRFLKKNVPSAGSLHPLEAYLMVRDVQGLAPGLYHYHAVAHELAPLPVQPDDPAGFRLRLLAGQHWFADAHVLLVLVCRFERTFWKYRNHAKAYRAVMLDAGHISQAFYSAATAQGLGAFVTAAINEAEAARALALQPMAEGALAVCGFGWRAATMQTSEMDPAGRVWPARITP